MPEGDTLYRAAQNAAHHLLDHVITHCETSLTTIDPELVIGKRLTEAKSIGKHLLLTFDHELTLHSHLGMNGRWRFSTTPRRLNANGGPNRIILRTAQTTAWCFGAPTLRLIPRVALAQDPILGALGPDILDASIAVDTLCQSFLKGNVDPPIGIALLDQRRCAGIGNVYNSECLFMEGIHPLTPVKELTHAAVFQLLQTTRRWMQRNVTPGRRGTRWPGTGKHWVYERGGQRCIKCDDLIQRTILGQPPRVTFHCPTCQPCRTNAV